MPSRYEADFTLKDNMSAGLRTIKTTSKQAEDQLKSLDRTVTHLSTNDGIGTWVKRSQRSLADFDKSADHTIAKIAEIKAAADGIGRDNVTVTVRTDGVDRTLAELMAIRTMQAQINGQHVSLSSTTTSQLPSGVRQDLQRLSAIDPSSTRSLNLAGGGMGGGASQGTTSDVPKLTTSLDSLRRSIDSLTGNRTGPSFANPGRSLAPDAGGSRYLPPIAGGAGPPLRPSGAAGGGGGGGLMSAGLSAAPLVAGSLLPPLAGLGAAMGGGIAGIGAGYAELAPAAAAVYAGGGVLKLGASPVTTGVSTAYQGLQQQQQLKMQWPSQLAQLQTQNQVGVSQQQEANAQNLLGLQMAGYGPGTSQYSQQLAANQASMSALAQSNAQSIAMARQQQQTALQQALHQPGVTPASIAAAKNYQGLVTEMRSQFGGGVRGSEQYGAANQALNFAHGPGMKILGQQWDAFFPVANRALTGVEKFGSSKSGQDQLRMWTSSLPTIAGDIASIAGNAAKLGGTLTHEVAPFTERGLVDLDTHFGHLNSYFNSPTGISSLNNTFQSAQPVLRSTAGFVGAMATGFDHMLTGGGGTAWTQIMDAATRDVPKVVSYMDKGTNTIPQLGRALHTFGGILSDVFGPSSSLNLGLNLLSSLLGTVHSLTSALSPGQMVAVESLMAAGGLAHYAKGSGLKTAGLAAGIGSTALGPVGLLFGGLGLMPGLTGGKGKGSVAAVRKALGAAETTAVDQSLMQRIKGALTTEGIAGRVSSVAMPAALTGTLLALTGQSAGTRIAGGAIGGAGIGSMVGGAIGSATDWFIGPVGTLGGAAIGSLVGGGLSALFGGGSSATKKPVATIGPTDVGDQATLEKYFNQMLVHNVNVSTPTGQYVSTGNGQMVPRYTTRRQQQTVGYGSQLTDEQALSISQQLQTADAQRATSLHSILGTYQQISRQLDHQKSGTAAYNTLLDQQKSTLQQIAQTAPSTVRYNQFGQPVSLNRHALAMQLTGMAHPTANAAAWSYLRTQQRTRSAASSVHGMESLAGRLDPGGPLAALANALASGNMTDVASIGALMQHQVGLGTTAGRRIGTAFHTFAGGPGPGLTVDRSEQQALQALVDQFGGTKPGSAFSRQLSAVQAYQRAQRNPGAGLPASVQALFATPGGGGTHIGAASGAKPAASTYTVKTIIDDLNSSSNTAATQQVGQTLVHNVAVGMDTQQSYSAVQSAATGIASYAVQSLGATAAISGAQGAGSKLVSAFSQGLQGAASGAAGSAADTAMYRLGFNIAWEVAQGAKAGAKSGRNAAPGGGGMHGAVGGMQSLIFGKGTKGMLERTDQGVDFGGLAPGAKIGSPGAGTAHVYPNFYRGQPMIEVTLDHAIDGHKYWYVAEQIKPAAGISGAHVRAGQTLGTYASSGTGLEMGWGAAGGATYASGHGGYKEGQQTGSGKSFAGALGVPALGTGQSKGFVAAARGFNGMVSGPTAFLAGEGGSPEHVAITPRGGRAGMGGVNVYVNIERLAAGDDAEYRRVMDKLTAELKQTFLNLGYEDPIAVS